MGKKKLKIFAAAAAFVPWVASSAQAGFVTPAGLNPGDHFYVIFVTTGRTDALSNDPTFYDSLVSTEATNAGLNSYAGSPVTWETLASFDGGPTAVDRFNPTAPIYRLDGVEIADNGADLWGTSSAQVPVDVASDGSISTALVWTGSDIDGTESIGLVGAKGMGAVNGASPPSSAFGDPSVSGTDWIFSASESQEFSNPLYAFSSELSVPVPEPASAGLLMIGSVLAIAGRGTRKK